MLRTYNIVENKIEALVGENKNEFLLPREEWIKGQQDQLAQTEKAKKDELEKMLVIKEGSAAAEHKRDIEMEALKQKGEIAIEIIKQKGDKAIENIKQKGAKAAKKAEPKKK